MPAAPTTILDAPVPVTRFKMTLNYDEYLADVSGNRGRFPAGAVLIVDEETAVRWYENGVAEPADPDAPTYGEIRKQNKRAEFLKRAQPVEGVFDRAVTRDSFKDERQLMPPPMPVPPTRRRRADLASAAITDLGDEE